MGVDEAVAAAFSSGAKIAIKRAFDESALGNLPTAFRATIPLVCPNLNTCLAKSEVFTTYMTPLLSTELKDIAGRLGAPRQGNRLRNVTDRRGPATADISRRVCDPEIRTRENERSMAIMSASAADSAELVFVVSPGLAQAARRDGIELPEGARVHLHVVTDAEPARPRRSLPWIGSVSTGTTDRSATYRETLRAEMGRAAE